MAEWSRGDLQLRLGCRVCGGPSLLTPGLSGVLAGIAVLHLIGWGVLLGAVVPSHLSLGPTVFGAGLELTAYLLGVRHAFDADHIAAIDNTTRRLIESGERPGTVGFWFSCGHSTVVLALTLLLAIGLHQLAGRLADAGSGLHRLTELIGTMVSGSFLYLVATVNLMVLVQLWSRMRRAGRDGPDAAAVEDMLAGRGFLNRLISRAAGVIARPRQMFAVGLLFGLGFDTATEIGLLVLAGTGASYHLPWYAILCLPVLFAAGMTLFGTLQSAIMTSAYGWALARPMGRIYYNLFVTAVSVAIALLIGTIEIAGLLSSRLNPYGGLWKWAADFDISLAGFVLAVLLLAIWGGALLFKYLAPDAEAGRIAREPGDGE